MARKQELSDCANRITLAEKQATHRQGHDNRAVSLYADEIKRGQSLGFTLAFTCITAGGLISAFVNIYSGGAFGVLGIVFLVSQTLGNQFFISHPFHLRLALPHKASIL